MWIELNNEQAARYDKLKGQSVSRNYDIRKALAEGKPIPPKPTLYSRVARSVSLKPEPNTTLPYCADADIKRMNGMFTSLLDGE